MGGFITVGLPLTLAFIMFSLGLGLRVRDFTDIATSPRPFLVGFAAQVVLVPAVAFALLLAFPLEDPLAFGVMILAFCPGGATTNLLARFARGDVALSVSLTAVVSLLSVVTVPLLVSVASRYFLGEEAPPVDITALALSLLLITTVPTAIGMLVRSRAPGFTARAEPLAVKISGVLFVLVVIGALASQLEVFLDNLLVLAPIVVVLNVVLLVLAYGLARVTRLGERRATTVAIEVGVQNSTLGITVAALLSQAELPVFAVPSAVYGITMYAVTIPAILVLRRRLEPVDAAP